MPGDLLEYVERATLDMGSKGQHCGRDSRDVDGHVNLAQAVAAGPGDACGDTCGFEARLPMTLGLSSGSHWHWSWLRRMPTQVGDLQPVRRCRLEGLDVLM